MAISNIEWTEVTWNPTTGCTKISSGCKYCYAETMSKRLHAMGVEKYKDGFKVRMHSDVLKAPYRWKKPKLVFVNSMSDLFHNNVPLEFIQRVFQVMHENPQHVFQILTKRADRLLVLDANLKWTHNIWMGVSVENDSLKNRIELLRKTKARIKFISFEPLIGPVNNLDLNEIDWVIVGGESGRDSRPLNSEWVTDIQRECTRFGSAFFFKQWGGRNKKANGRILNGRTYDEMPELENISLF
ncbi:MAG: phage Gp37/Gp68 family protein [Calditrichaeota bacterium]|nr:MAG: phage Gp37/Gp68 family protein [Calditrichota bacterium]